MDTLLVALRVALSLGVVLALLWVVQRRMAKTTGGQGRGRARRTAAVQVVARQGIGGKASVVVVDVEGERLVLGVTETQVAVLSSGTAPVAAPTLELVPPIAEVVVTETATFPSPDQRTSQQRVAPATAAVDADPFGAVLAAQDQAVPSLPAVSDPTTPATTAATTEEQPLRLRPRNRRASHVAVPTPQQLQGSILSADTWRQAAAAVRARRAG